MPVEEIYRLYGLTKEEYEGIVKRLCRKPNHVELGVLGALWSEHCSYKSAPQRVLRVHPPSWQTNPKWAWCYTLKRCLLGRRE
jgi:phosphoribosylformylglycinamidine (FGAM) synthase-like enzyme